MAGWGQASDGHNVAISHPEGSGLEDAIERALKATGIAAETGRLHQCPRYLDAALANF